jgi:hypothetical protein
LFDDDIVDIFAPQGQSLQMLIYSESCAFAPGFSVIREVARLRRELGVPACGGSLKSSVVSLQFYPALPGVVRHQFYPALPGVISRQLAVISFQFVTQLQVVL